MRISDWRSDVCSSDLLAGARLEIAPEAFEHRLPLRATARHVVEFLLQPRGEIIADIAFEEAFEEGGEQAPAFFGDEAVFPDRHIGAILDRKSTRLNSSHSCATRMPTSAGKKKIAVHH